MPPLLHPPPFFLSRPRLHPIYRLRLLRYHATAPSFPPTGLRRFLPRLPPSLISILLPLGTLLTWLPAIPFLTNTFITLKTITGPSMSPTLNPTHPPSTTRDTILLSFYRPHIKNLRRGQIIAFRSPSNPERIAIKRVIAVEGDRVVTRSPYPIDVVDVPVGCVWVEGDEGAGKSLDSNWYGPVSRALVVGRAVGVVWPWGRRGWLGREEWGGNERVREGVGKVEEYEIH